MYQYLHFKKTSVITHIKELSMVIFGTLLNSAGIYYFTAPNHIAPGGITGISTVVNYLTGFPIGVLMLLCNIPLILFALKKIGLKYIIFTFTALALFSFLVDYIYPMTPFRYSGDLLLASVFGGALIGSGLSFIFMAGGSSGGVDIIVHLLRRKFPHLPNGMLFFFFDLFVITLASIIYKEINLALYALISVFLSARVLDAMMFGFDSGRLIFIVSNKNDQIKSCILRDLHRGVTILKGKGGYQLNEVDVLLCAVRTREFYTLKAIVKEIDNKAFIMAANTSDIAGEGFNTI